MPEQKDKTVTLNVKLKPVDNSDQPLTANYTTIGVAQGIAYLDMGFIEPVLLATIARGAQDGQVMPNVEGKLVVRVAMGLDVLARLRQQIQQVLIELRDANLPKTNNEGQMHGR